MRVIGYTFDADVYCVNCTKSRHAKNLFTFDRQGTEGKDPHGIPHDATDTEDNLVCPIFSTDEQIETYHCRDCQGRIE